MAGVTTDVLGGTGSSQAEDVVDGIVSSSAMKGPCLIVTQTPVTLSGEQTLQGETTDESRVLVAGQADARENGIYVTSTGVWRRAKDFSRTVDVRKGTQIRVTDGTRPGIWTVTSENPIAFGTSDINFSVDEAITTSDVTVPIAAWLADPTSAKLAAALSDETGTAGNVIFSTSPTFQTRGILSTTEDEGFFIDVPLAVNSDYLGGYWFRGRSSTGVVRDMGGLRGFISDNTNGAEDAKITVEAIVAGALETVATFNNNDFAWLYDRVNIVSNAGRGRYAWPNADLSYIEGADDKETGWVIATYGANGFSSISGRKALGTWGSPAQVSGATNLFTVRGIARDDSGVWGQGTSVEIALRASGAHTTTSHPTEILFKTTASSSTTLTTRVTLEGGGRLLLNSGQLGFPGTANASSDANTFDDYEEGSWIVVVIGQSTAGAGTYSTQAGTYTKKGREVSVIGECVWSAHTGTGNMKLGGLPFTNANFAGFRVPVALYYTNLTFAGPVVGTVDLNATTITLETVATGAGSSALPIDTAATIRVHATYFL